MGTINVVDWTALGSFLATLAGGATIAIRFIVRKIEASAQNRHEFETLLDRLDAIESQYRRNGGSSLRDAVDRIETSVSVLTSNVDRIDKSLERHLGFHDAID